MEMKNSEFTKKYKLNLYNTKMKNHEKTINFQKFTSTDITKIHDLVDSENCVKPTAHGHWKHIIKHYNPMMRCH